MTDRELLKEARDALSEIHYGVTKEYWSKCKAIADRIDTALAEPDTTKMDAGQLVEKIRDYFLDDYDANFYMPFSVACALIESYGRRVPRAMLEEIERRACRNGDIGGCSCLSLNKIAAKYGVKIEEDGK